MVDSGGSNQAGTHGTGLIKVSARVVAVQLLRRTFKVRSQGAESFIQIDSFPDPLRQFPLV